MKRVIVWEKWENPFEPNEEFDYDPEDTELSYEEKVGRDRHKRNEKEHKVIITEHGIIPIMNPKALAEVMNFWVGHTDFSICFGVCEVITETPGVESYEVMSPYRMRIAIAKVFKANKVMSNISKRVSEFFQQLKSKPEATRNRTKVTELINSSKAKQVPWLVQIAAPEPESITNDNS